MEPIFKNPSSSGYVNHELSHISTFVWCAVRISVLCVITNMTQRESNFRPTR